MVPSIEQKEKHQRLMSCTNPRWPAFRLRSAENNVFYMFASRRAMGCRDLLTYEKNEPKSRENVKILLEGLLSQMKWCAARHCTPANMSRARFQEHLAFATTTIWSDAFHRCAANFWRRQVSKRRSLNNHNKIIISYLHFISLYNSIKYLINTVLILISLTLLNTIIFSRCSSY